MTTSITNTLDTDNLFDGEQSLNQIRQRTTRVVSEAMQSGGSTLVDAMPAAGKTYSTFDSVADNNLQISYLTERKELYREAEERSEERGLSYKILPSPHRECPTFQGEYGEDLKKKVRAIYDRGVSGGDIHAEIDLPCDPDCPYSRGWDFEPEDYDVLVGHYNHSRVPKVTGDRIVVVDEFPGDNSIQTFENPAPIVSNYLEDRPGLPFDSWSDVIEGRRDDERRQQAFRYFVDHGRDISAEEVIEDDSGHAHTTAGLLFGSLLLMEDLKNGWESTTESTVEPVDGTPWSISRRDIVGETRCVRDRGDNSIYLLDSPEISEPESVVGLDGTPCLPMWNLAFGMDFSAKKVVPDRKKNKYVHDILGIDLYRPEYRENGGLKPYHSERNITGDKDEGVLFGLEQQTGEKPGLISTATAVGGQDKTGFYEKEGVIERAGLTKNFAEIHSSNEFNQCGTGMISGCPHPGDKLIKRWSALMGHGVETEDRGLETDFGDLGNAVYNHYVHDEVLQAILRFSRDGSGATVLVNTLATPGWLTVEDAGFKAYTGKKRIIVESLQIARNGATQQNITDMTGVSRGRVSEIIGDFKSEGLVDFTTDENGTLKYSWTGS